MNRALNPRRSLLSFACLLVLMPCCARAESIVGWRGNWNGEFPDARPPLEWRQVSPIMEGLRCQAEKPKDAGPSGVPVYHGSINQWMILGPFPAQGAEAVAEAFVEDEAGLEPVGDREIKGKKWRKIEGERVINFAERFKDECRDTVEVPHNVSPFYYCKAPYAVYAHTYLYAPREGKVVLKFVFSYQGRIYVNGEQVPLGNAKGEYTLGYHRFALKKGWNRLLVKVANDTREPGQYNRYYPSWWYIDLELSSDETDAMQTTNILWKTRMPNPQKSYSSPIVAGDSVFFVSEPGDLVCMNKNDGRIRWIRSLTYYDLIDEKERKSSPDFAEIGENARKLAALNDAFVNLSAPDQKLEDERLSLHAAIDKAMRKIDGEKYCTPKEQDGVAMPTPVADGKNVYVWLCNGIAASFDFKGNRNWIAGVSADVPFAHHGYGSSPVISEGRFITTMSRLTAFDLKDGRIAWTTDLCASDKNAGSLAFTTPLVFKIGGADYLYYNSMIVRSADGKVVWVGEWRKWCNPGAIYFTPVIENNVLYRGHLKSKLPDGADNIALENTSKIGYWMNTSFAIAGGFGTVASPLYHDGLLYIVERVGLLVVIDTRTDTLAYKKDLGIGLGGNTYASPILAGKYIYIFGGRGTTIVLEPGRQYKEVARNKIECPITWGPHWNPKTGELEEFIATPAVEGSRFFVRGSRYFYCIGEK